MKKTPNPVITASPNTRSENWRLPEPEVDVDVEVLVVVLDFAAVLGTKVENAVGDAVGDAVGESVTNPSSSSNTMPRSPYPGI